MFEFFKNLTLSLIAAIEQKGEVAIFLGGLIEQIIIPIPSPLIAMAGGFLLIPPNIPFGSAVKIAILKITLPYTGAATVGIGIVYFIAYFGGKPIIEKFKTYLGFSWQEIENLQKKLTGSWYDELLIIVLRAIPIIPISVVSGVCGAIRTSIPLFYIASIIGILIRSFVLAILGWQTGEAYQAVAGRLDRVENVVAVIILGIIVLVLVWGYTKREHFLKGKDKS